MQTQASQQAAETRRGTVLAVCTSPRGGLPKYPQPRIVVGAYGVEGDHHYGPRRFRRSVNALLPNDRQVTILGRETLEAMNAHLGISLVPGHLGENVLVEGLGLLSDVPAGTHLLLGDAVVLEITGQNEPCALLIEYHKHLTKSVRGRRGLTAVVVSQGEVRPGDRVALRLPS